MRRQDTQGASALPDDPAKDLSYREPEIDQLRSQKDQVGGQTDGQRALSQGMTSCGLRRTSWVDRRTNSALSQGVLRSQKDQVGGQTDGQRARLSQDDLRHDYTLTRRRQRVASRTNCLRWTVSIMLLSVI